MSISFHNSRARGEKKCTRKRFLIGMLILAVLIVCVFLCTEISELPFTRMTTIGQLSEEISVLTDKPPTSLVYTESDELPDTFNAMVDDPAIVKEALDIILSADVDKRGCYIDMYRMPYSKLTLLTMVMRRAP